MGRHKWGLLSKKKIMNGYSKWEEGWGVDSYGIPRAWVGKVKTWMLSVVGYEYFLDLSIRFEVSVIVT